MPRDPASKTPGGAAAHRWHNPFALLASRRFAPLLLTQCLGAFNDSLIKHAPLGLLISHAAGCTAWTLLTPGTSNALAATAYGLPVIFFSATAGQLADKYDKALLARLVKILEILSMGTAALAILWHSPGTLLAALIFLGLRATLLAPVSYAILPQQLRAHELVSGNALMATGTLAALLAGALFSTLDGDGVAITGLIAATTGLLASLAIPSTPSTVPELRLSLNPVSESWRNIGFARENRTIFLSILGISSLWFCAALLLTQLPSYCRAVVSTDEPFARLLLAVFALGIAAGSLLCRPLSGKFLDIGLLPFAAMAQAAFALELFFALPEAMAAGTPAMLTAQLGEPRFWRILVDLCGLGMFCGVSIVALNVLIQMRSATPRRARILSVYNQFNILSVVAGCLVATALPSNGTTLPWLFAAAAPVLVGAAAYGYFRVPHLALRFLTGLLIHSFYRLEKTGFEYLPENGPAVLVCNHVSFVDSLVIMAAVRRPIRFVIDHRIHQAPLVGFVFRHCRTIPIATAKEDPALKEAAFDEVARALNNGELIGLFPEGKITRNGEINHFRYGLGRIVAETPVPVIPMALRGLWGSFFSRRYGPAMSKPSLLRYLARIELVAGQPVAADRATPEQLQEIVTELRGGLV